MKFLVNIYDFLVESVGSYEFKMVSDTSYSFFDKVGNEYLVDFDEKSSSIYELKYYVLSDNSWNVSKVVNVNPWVIVETVFGLILRDFIDRMNPTKVFFTGLSKDIENDYISTRTKMYARYLRRNEIDGYELIVDDNKITLYKINI